MRLDHYLSIPVVHGSPSRVALFALFLLSLCFTTNAAPPQFSGWDTVSPESGWTIHTGHFNADDLADVLAYYSGNGTVWVGLNGGDHFITTRWAVLTPNTDWQFAVGQFDGRGYDDIVAYAPTDGSVYVGHNQGTEFALTRWATVSPASGWKIAAGNLNGEGGDDVLAYLETNHTLWIGHNRSDRFDFHKVNQLSAKSGRQIDVGNFDNQGNDDVLAYDPTNGSLWVGLSQGDTYVFSQWASVTPAAGWDFAPGNFDGDSADELVGYHPINGSMWLGYNQGSRFNFNRWGADMAPTSGWSFQTGRFVCGGERDDLVGYQSDTGGLWVGAVNQKPAEGYVWPLSAAPGETVQIHASGLGSPHVDILRYASGETLMTTLTYTPAEQATQARPWRYGAGWEPSFDLTIPNDWPSGMYAVRFQNDTGCHSYATFVVKPEPTRQSRVAVLANVNTWQAYNSWGGRGKYHGAALVSFLRPNPSAVPVGETKVTQHLARAERWILGWLEDEGYQPDLFTDIDFHDGLVQGYDTLVVGTHPEYWSPEMFMRLRAFLDGGGSLLYLGGNGLFEEGEFNCDRTQMMFLDGDENGKRPPAMFRVADPTRPHRLHERSVLGVATDICGPEGRPFDVLLPEHPLFAGTGVVAGDGIGAMGLNTSGGAYNGAASAWEVDTSTGDPSRPLGCESGDYPVIDSPLPAGLQVLARANPGGEITFYQHPGGGSVFAAGSITFGGSLVIDPQLQQLLRNVLSLSLD